MTKPRTIEDMGEELCDYCDSEIKDVVGTPSGVLMCK